MTPLNTLWQHKAGVALAAGLFAVGFVLGQIVSCSGAQRPAVNTPAFETVRIAGQDVPLPPPGGSITIDITEQPSTAEESREPSAATGAGMKSRVFNAANSATTGNFNASVPDLNVPGGGLGGGFSGFEFSQEIASSLWAGLVLIGGLAIVGGGFLVGFGMASGWYVMLAGAVCIGCAAVAKVIEANGFLIVSAFCVVAIGGIVLYVMRRAKSLESNMSVLVKGIESAKQDIAENVRDLILVEAGPSGVPPPQANALIARITGGLPSVITEAIRETAEREGKAKSLKTEVSWLKMRNGAK